MQVALAPGSYIFGARQVVRLKILENMSSVVDFCYAARLAYARSLRGIFKGCLIAAQHVSESSDGTAKQHRTVTSLSLWFKMTDMDRQVRSIEG